MRAGDPSPILWIGLAEVGARDKSSILSGIGAFVNVVGPARNRDEFEKRVGEALEELGVDLLNLEHVEPLRQRLENYEVAAEVVEVAKEAEVDGEVHFGTFYNYPPAN